MKTYGYIYRSDPYAYSGYTRDRIRLTEHYTLERRIEELRARLSVERPDVFVSHKSDDTDTAKRVARTIARCGLEVYLDVWDHNIDGDGPELVDYISSVIGCCRSLIAVVSPNTVSSWWVPLEIGIAITKDLHLGTFLARIIHE
ncbi:MAG: toll/interleukin-1 receptor domain-containing protein [Gemmatimonadota bacterium]|nr:toll/interleukin-1 receptor domain-containing protein [Gemmatimonadota bacterium]